MENYYSLNFALLVPSAFLPDGLRKDGCDCPSNCCYFKYFVKENLTKDFRFYIESFQADHIKMELVNCITCRSRFSDS